MINVTEWEDPNRPPDMGKSVLLKRASGAFVVGYYWERTWWVPARWGEEVDCPVYDIVGWCLISEESGK